MMRCRRVGFTGPAAGPMGLFFEQVTMAPGSLEIKCAWFLSVNQQPVRLDMAIPRSASAPGKRVIPVPNLHVFISGDPPNDVF